MKCCDNQKPINIGILKEKWVCKECDADLKPTDKIGVFENVTKPKETKPYWTSDGWQSPITPDSSKITEAYDQDDPYWMYVRGFD